MKLLSTQLSLSKLCIKFLSFSLLSMAFLSFALPNTGYSQGVCGTWEYQDVTALQGEPAGATNPSIAINASGTPYIAFRESGLNALGKAKVLKLENGFWTMVGYNGGLPTNYIDGPSLALDGSGTPYIAYADQYLIQKATVMKFDSTSWSWVLVGTAGFTSENTGSISIAINNSGTPYMAYTDGVNGDKPSVMKYNGTAWVPVGSSTSISSASAIGTHLAIDAAGTPYVAFQDGNNNNKATVMKYNGSAWVPVGNVGFTPGQASSLCLALDGNGTPYVAYIDIATGLNQASVMKYNGSSWVQVGNAGFTPGAALHTSIAIDGSGTPYVAFKDFANNEKTSVMKYNGTTWVPLGNLGFSTGIIVSTSIAINANGTAYVAYTTGAAGSVMVNKIEPCGNLSNNIAPTFVNVSPQTLTVCQNSVGVDIAGLLHVSDTDTSQAESWSQFAAPSHGTLSFVTATATSGSTNITPGGSITYTPNAGYLGPDAFTIKVSDGISTATMVVNVTVTTTVTSSISITANPTGAMCSGTSVTYTATNTNGGTSPTYQWKKNGVNAGTNSSTYTYTPNNGDSIRCVMTSSLSCTVPMSSNTINMVVTPTVTPSVSINVSPNDTVCAGTAVTYTATITNGGTTPTYQWKKNGVNVGTNSNTYSYVPNNGDSVRCVLTSNATCASPTIVSSNTIHMTVNPSVTPTITVASSPTGTICAGGTAAYTANITNGGPNPTFQWKKNGVNVGANSSIYNCVPNNGDSIRCVLTSTAACATQAIVSSSTVNMVVAPIVSPTITIAASATGAICAGTPVTYTATISNGGTTPTYQWKVNGTNVGTNSNNYTYAPNNGDTISCVLTSNATCVVPAVVTSSTIIMAVTPTVIPTISITANPNDTVCTGTAVTYTASITNGGTTPGYQWIMNGSNVGTNSSTYTYTPNNGDSVRCVMTSNATCTSQAIVNSNYTHMTVQPLVTPTIAIAASPAGAVCAGTTVAYTTTITNGGTSPGYQWKKNGANAGTNNSVYTYTPNNGDSVRCVMTSNNACANPTTANSNSIVETVNPLIIPTITISAPTGAVVGSAVTATATVTNAGSSYTIHWKNRGVAFATTNVPPANGNSTTYTKVAGTDSITAKVVVTSGGCYDSATTASYTIVATTVGVGNINSANNVVVYPNPANNIVHVDNLTTNVDYQLQNLVGMTVLRGTFTQEQNTLLIKELPSGIDLLQLTNTEGQREVVRVVKE
jgi:Bacterial Ig domain/Secretion system C-terminal sorting domain